MPAIAEFEDLLRAAALRVTRPRVAVLAAAHAHPHADTDTLITAVRAELPDVSHQAVYRSCGVIVDVDCAVGKAPCIHTSPTDGFRVDEAEVIYWGVCASCAHPQPPKG